MPPEQQARQHIDELLDSCGLHRFHLSHLNNILFNPTQLSHRNRLFVRQNDRLDLLYCRNKQRVGGLHLHRHPVGFQRWGGLLLVGHSRSSCFLQRRKFK